MNFPPMLQLPATTTMKTSHAFGLALFFFLLLFVLVSVDFNPSLASTHAQIPAITVLQVTPTPQTEDASVVGSTDGIMLMGVVITFIVIMPLLFHKKRN